MPSEVILVIVAVALLVSVVYSLIGRLIVVSYLRSGIALHYRVEQLLFLLAGPYGWLVLIAYIRSGSR